jgi:hypothetical protein
MRGSRSGSISAIPIENERRVTRSTLLWVWTRSRASGFSLFELLNLGAVTI